MSNVGNTLGTTGVVTGPQIQFIIAGGNNITLSQSINGVSGTLTISGENVSQYLTTAGLSQDSSKYAFTGFTTTTIAGAVVAGTHNTDGLKLAVPAYLTTADLSQNSSNYAGIGETVGTIAGTDLAMTVNTDGVSIKYPKWITAAAGGGGFTAGVSTGGNTLGDTNTVGSQIIFAGGNNITLSQATNGDSATVTISAPNAFSAGLSTGGNSAGTSSIQSGRIVLAGGANITLSQATAANDYGTITVSGQNPGAQNMSFWQNMGVNGSATDAMAQTRTSHGQLNIFQLDIGNNIFAGNMTVSTMLIDMTCSHTVTIANYTWKLLVGLYYLAGSQMVLQYSASTAISSSQASGASFSISNMIHGQRYLTFNGSTQFTSMNSTGGATGATDLTLSQGLYYMGFLPISSSNSFNASWYGNILGESGARSGTFGVTVTTGTAAGRFPWMGVYSTTTAALPQSIANAFLQKTSLDAIFIPHIVFNNLPFLTNF